MYQVILRSRGLEITIDSEDDADLSLDLLKDLTDVLHLSKHSIRITPANEPGDYRGIRETGRDTSQADALEQTLRQIGKPASPMDITTRALASAYFNTKAKNPADLVRQILRKYPRFTQINRKLWTLTDGFDKSAEEVFTGFDPDDGPRLDFGEVHSSKDLIADH